MSVLSRGGRRFLRPLYPAAGEFGKLGVWVWRGGGGQSTIRSENRFPRILPRAALIFTWDQNRVPTSPLESRHSKMCVNGVGYLQISVATTLKMGANGVAAGRFATIISLISPNL